MINPHNAQPRLDDCRRPLKSHSHEYTPPVRGLTISQRRIGPARLTHPRVATDWTECNKARPYSAAPLARSRISTLRRPRLWRGRALCDVVLLSSLKCSTRKRTGGVDIRHYRSVIYAFRDCISPFASPFVEIYYERGSRRQRAFARSLSRSALMRAFAFTTVGSPFTPVPSRCHPRLSLSLSSFCHGLRPLLFPSTAFLRLPPNHGGASRSTRITTCKRETQTRKENEGRGAGGRTRVRGWRETLPGARRAINNQINEKYFLPRARGAPALECTYHV